MGPEAKHHGFWLGSSPGKADGREEGQWENVLRNPFLNLLENLPEYLTCAQFSLAKSSTSKIKDRTPQAWVTVAM